MAIKNEYLQKLMATVEKRNPDDKQFLITVRSALESLEPVVEAHPEYRAKMLENIARNEKL